MVTTRGLPGADSVQADVAAGPSAEEAGHAVVAGLEHVVGALEEHVAGGERDVGYVDAGVHDRVPEGVWQEGRRAGRKKEKEHRHLSRDGAGRR